MAVVIFEVEHDPLHARSNILLAKTEFSAHLQHGHVLSQHIAVHAPQTFFLGVVDDALHQ
jgi:hypothetical protein